MKNRFRTLLILCWLALPLISGAQSADPLTDARFAAAQKDYKKAISLYDKAYEQSPNSNDVYTEYLNVLIAAKEFRDAEKLVNSQQRFRYLPLLQIDMGRIQVAAGKDKKAEEQFDAAIQGINGDDILTQQLATAFSAMGRDDYAVKAYERARDLLHNPYLYSGAMARLYAKTGAIDKAVTVMLDAGPGMMNGPEDTKATLLEILGNDPKKLLVAQKTLIKRINQQPDNSYFSDLLTWLYTQKGDWDGALLQIQALDERNKETGQRLLEFARFAEKEGQHEAALKTLDVIIAKGKDLPYYSIAKSERLNVSMDLLETNPAFTKDDVAKLSAEYAAFFQEYPQYLPTEVLRDYARLEAQYNNNPKKAIALLQSAIGQANASRDFIGRCKLQLGDYQILDGKVWDASLTYSQVDKAFREDMLGEEARFRNGKLAYYRGDFGWAQGQLSVLKASTSELIANDALYLSVLITENTPDSNVAALRRFAHADLLLFQNKDAEAIAVLDSISREYPKHPLNDDILMLRANIAKKHRDYPKTLDYLKQIYEGYGKDVLADDAVFRTAELYEQYLKQPEEAKKFYEKLILEYPGSTYVQTARQRLQQLASGGAGSL